MSKVYWNSIFVDKDPDDIYKGWGWVEMKVEDSKKFNLTSQPESYTRQMPLEERRKIANRGNLPSRGRGGTKKFNINLNGEIITVRAQKSLTNKALCAWVKSWAPPNTKIITPGNRELSVDGVKLAKILLAKVINPCFEHNTKLADEDKNFAIAVLHVLHN